MVFSASATDSAIRRSSTPFDTQWIGLPLTARGFPHASTNVVTSVLSGPAGARVVTTVSVISCWLARGPEKSEPQSRKAAILSPPMRRAEYPGLPIPFAAGSAYSIGMPS